MEMIKKNNKVKKKRKKTNKLKAILLLFKSKINRKHERDIYPILSGTFALKLDSAVASAQFPLPALLRRNDTNAFLFTAGKDTPGLPPLVV